MKIAAEISRQFRKKALVVGVKSGVTRSVSAHRVMQANHGCAVYGVAVRQLQTLQSASPVLQDVRDDEIAMSSDTPVLENRIMSPVENEVTSSTASMSFESQSLDEANDEYELHMSTMKQTFETFHRLSSHAMSSFDDPLPLPDEALLSDQSECYDPLAVDISHYRGGSADDYSAGVNDYSAGVV